jgi:hypothetical protein
MLATAGVALLIAVGTTATPPQHVTAGSQLPPHHPLPLGDLLRILPPTPAQCTDSTQPAPTTR